MGSQTNQSANQSSQKYADGTYTHPISVLPYLVIDGCARIIDCVAGPISEEAHREELAQRSRRLHEREDRARANGPSLLDSVADGIRTIRKPRHESN